MADIHTPARDSVEIHHDGATRARTKRVTRFDLIGERNDRQRVHLGRFHTSLEAEAEMATRTHRRFWIETVEIEEVSRSAIAHSREFTRDHCGTLR